MSKQKAITPAGMLRSRWLALSCLVAGVCLLTASPAVASPPAPAWKIAALPRPTTFVPGTTAEYMVTITNVGTAPATGSGVTVTATLPEGLTPHNFNSCTVSGQSMTCPVTPELPTTAFEPGQDADISFGVDVAANAPETITSTLSVSGGGAPTASTIVQTPISSTPPPFGLAQFGSEAFNQDGTPTTQAGGHPYAMTTTIAFNSKQSAACTSFFGCDTVVDNGKDVQIATPPGLIANPQAIPQCTQGEFQEQNCPQASLIGVSSTYFTNGIGPQRHAVYNMVPPPGVPAEFAFEFNSGALVVRVRLDARVRTGSDYGATVSTSGISQEVGVVESKVTLWGVPAAHIHDDQRCGPSFARSWIPVCTEAPPSIYGPHSAGVPLKPFLTLPTSCPGAPLPWSMGADSWQEPGQFMSAMTSMPATTGCEALDFSPTLDAHPTTGAADSSSGLNMDLHLPQHEGCEEEAGGEVVCENAEAELKDATFTLPAGLVVNPSSGDGLAGCPLLSGKEPTQEASESKGEVSGINLETPYAPNCPEASKLGTVEVDTPLVGHPLPGGMYLAQQGANPFKSLLALYLVLNDPASGVVIKVAGKVTLDPTTGQLTATFDNNPQLPFEELKVDLFGGTRAAFTTPLTCGSYLLATDLTPWSGGKDATPSSAPFNSFTGCVSSEAQAPNSPTLEAGTASPVAGTYSPFVLNLKREDGSQHFSAVNVTLPPGLSGKVAGVEECPQADIEAAQSRSNEGEGALELAHPSCPAGSEVGVVHVGTGSGAPLYVTGHAYFAGPYKGGPFSLVFITPAVAGPFDLGSTVVRAALFIDPNTAQVTVKSDPLPTILYGIPLDIRSIAVEVNRHEFTLNPTSCAEMSVSGQEASTAGQVAALSDRFQAGGCTTLPFDPSFSVSASANSNPKEGAALIVRVSSGQGQANLSRVHVELPKQLPSRLTTLQKACPDTAFNANPATCPATSRVGYATASTPILPVPIAGPAYFVSHGGAAFPELIMVLSGDGVTVDLHGETFINKANITSSTFPSLPDVPVTSFELKLPEGPYSALDANGDLCSQKLVMPTTMTGQNGARISQKTPISIEGCKPQMRVLSHRVNGKRASIRVSVPSAGTLVASGRALRRSVKRVDKAKVVTIGVRLSRHDLRVLAHHPHQRVNAKVELRFAPKHGAPMTAHLRLLMG